MLYLLKLISTELCSETTITFPTNNKDKINKYIIEFKNNPKVRKLIFIDENGKETVLVDKS